MSPSAAAPSGWSCLTPLMKKVGVPLTPLRIPPMKSARIFLASGLTRASRNSIADSPRLVANALSSRNAETMLVGIDRVMHRPETIVATGKFGSLGRRSCERMHFRQRKMTEDEAKSRPQASMNLLHDRLRHCTVGALIIAVLDERDESTVVALYMIKRLAEFWALPFLSSSSERASSASRMPSAPGLTAMGER